VLNRIAPRLRVPTPIKGSQLATDPRVGAAYFADPLVVRTSTPALGHAMLSQVEWANAHLAEFDGRALPTLVQHGSDDSLVPAASTVAFGAMAGVRRIAYPGLRHEIFNEPSGPAVLDDLVAWLDTVL
jgi:alpha-beta hydrolase superfamily lysophospholipase